MIQEVIDGIVVKLHDSYDCPIYQEDIPQGFKQPCFAIRILNPMEFTKSANRYLRIYPFVINYFPKSETQSKAEMCEVAEKLLLELEYITVRNNSIDNLLRGTRMRFEIVDDVLHFFVNYDFFVKRVVEKEPFESMTINSKVEE